MKIALNIHITGIVQGVGFRPFVYKEALSFNILGWVLNSADGVHIHAEGEESDVDKFCLSLSNNAPQAAVIEQIEMNEIPLENHENFQIINSKDEKFSRAGDESNITLISPDIATCDDCLTELFDVNNRRYRYPFINCTNCGPRFTIINALPYDRVNTSMNEFIMCDTCSKEYNSPVDRRFHAQPNACFECGPYINWVESKNIDAEFCKTHDLSMQNSSDQILWGSNLEKSDKIFSNAVNFLLKGKTLAIKGLGGFHLACDASNNAAVESLRKKKQRSNKAFAIMALDINSVKKICELNDTEQKILESSNRPIVLLKTKKTAELAPSVYNGLPEIGVMLPYTPVQHILMHDFVKLGGKYLVMTSGNIYDNPILTEDKKAWETLGDVADAFIGNNRKIVSRYDDSVVRVINAGGIDAVQMIRRARGYAPSPIKITKSNARDQIFATGPEQKNTFCYLRPLPGEASTDKYNAEAFVSQHIGDLENAEVHEAWLSSKNAYENIFRFEPNKIVCDMHPEYISSKWAHQQIGNSCEIQHHFAHIASVMAENKMEGPVCGFAFDGTGYGVDGQIWGGEVLLCNTKDFERFANLVYMPMPGSVSAIKHPMYMAYGALWTYDLLNHDAAKDIFSSIEKKDLENINTIVEQGINCPYTSSIGRALDAFSALLGICQNPTYEGEAAIMLEAFMWEGIRNNKELLEEKFDKRYEVQIKKNSGTEKSTAHDTSVVILDFENTFRSVLDDIKNGISKYTISKRIHDAICNMILTVSQLVNQIYGITDIALSGGVFMNRYLIETSIKLLTNNGFNVAINRELPPNDGCISLGQAYVSN